MKSSVNFHSSKSDVDQSINEVNFFFKKYITEFLLNIFRRLEYLQKVWIHSRRYSSVKLYLYLLRYRVQVSWETQIRLIICLYT